MTTVYLVRHAEAEGNLYRRAQGHYNGVTTPRGFRQIAALAHRFDSVHLDAVYSSDLIRTRATALAAYWTHHLPLRTDPVFREVCMGEWENKTWAQIEQFDGYELEKFNTDCEHWSVKGGEPIAEAGERMLGGLRRVIAAHPGETIAVFSHGMAMRTLIGLLGGLTYCEIDHTPHMENTAVTKLEAEDGEIRIVYKNDASHLTDDLATLKGQAWIRDARGFEGGIWYEPKKSGYSVCSPEGVIGEVSLGRIDGKTAELGNLELIERARGRHLGSRLIGQAIVAAREQGCDTLRWVIPKENAQLVHMAEKDGAVLVRETDKAAVYERYFEFTEEYGIAQLRSILGR